MLRDQAEALAVLEAWALNPTAGLPYELFLFISRLVPMTNVDLLVYDDEGRILLTWRDEPIHGVGWHVPGGMIRYKETAEDRVRATALEELGAGVEFEGPPIVEQIIEPERRVRGHHISLLYKCRLLSAPSQAIRFTHGEPRAGQWAWHTRCPENMIAAHQRYGRFFA
jgi:ADP-ribose pyrophosphatase YjhB (NUDIX family)